MTMSVLNGVLFQVSPPSFEASMKIRPQQKPWAGLSLTRVV